MTVVFSGCLIVLSGCASTAYNQKDIYPFASVEVEWIRNGAPIEFENILWYPTDIVENLLDDEVYLLGEYREAQFFVDKADVRPYERIYTKFGKHKFRVFEKRTINDKG